MYCWKYCKGYKFALSVARPRAKKLSASEGLRHPDPLTRGSAPGPRWELCPQTPATTPHCKPPGLATVLGHCITYVVGLWFHYPVHALQSRQMSAQTAATAMHNRIGLSRHYHICSVDDRICYNELQYWLVPRVVRRRRPTERDLVMDHTRSSSDRQTYGAGTKCYV